MTGTRKGSLRILNQILVLLLGKCNLEMKNIIVLDDTNSMSTFQAISIFQPLVSVSLFSNWSREMKRDIYKEIVQVDGMVIVVNLNNDLTWMDLLLANKWSYGKNCTIFILPEPYNACSSAWAILKSMTRLYIPLTHYICLHEWRQPIVFTFNPYGDTKPRYWINDGKSEHANHNWTVYYRALDRNSSGICEGFYFERKHPENETYVVLGIVSHLIYKNTKLKEQWIYNEELEPYLEPYVMTRIDQLKKLLKVKFLYHILWMTESLDYIFRAYSHSLADVVLLWHFLISTEFDWKFFHPVLYDDYSILSYNRGLKTPLEKIISFYGIWTLISIILVSTIAFIVMWLKTKKNIYSATFNVIRLLINSGVNFKIDIMSLKIFFCMIFMYFMVIHATFSGHLAEFLTKPELKKNADTLQDLKDSRIETIYNYGFLYGNIEDVDILNNKTTLVRFADGCSEFVRRTPKSVCIGHASIHKGFRVFYKDWNNTFYISKNVLRSSASAYLYRPGFPLREKINWGIMTLSETQVLNRHSDEGKIKDSIILERQKKQSEINFRSITMADIRFSFFLLLFGNSLGIICFLCELYIGRKRMKNQTITRSNVQMSNKNNTLTDSTAY